MSIDWVTEIDKFRLLSNKRMSSSPLETALPLECHRVLLELGTQYQLVFKRVPTHFLEGAVVSWVCFHSRFAIGNGMAVIPDWNGTDPFPASPSAVSVHSRTTKFTGSFATAWWASQASVVRGTTLPKGTLLIVWS